MESGGPKSLVGCCGLYCGLCSRYQSKAASRCAGCGLGEQHSWCSIWNCCVKKHGFETCAECCEVLTCPIFLRRRVAEWIPAADNLRQIQEVGMGAWLKQQEERQSLLEELLQKYNEGRSMSLYCKFCSRMSRDSIEEATQRAEELTAEKTDGSDTKSRAKILRAIMRGMALSADVNLD